MIDIEARLELRSLEDPTVFEYDAWVKLLISPA